MFWIYFLFGSGALSEVSLVYSEDVFFKACCTSGRNNGDVLFKDRRYVRKAQPMCNKYTSLACHGILTLLPKSIETTTEDGYSSIFVVGGKQALPREYPHMALIGYGEYVQVRWSCGGSLISENYVLSAAHCSSPNAEPAAWIRLGELDLSSKTEESTTMDFEILQRIVHPEYHPPALYNDIALFKFKGISKFTVSIRPICLNIFDNFETTKVTALGWGATGYGEQNSDSLLSVDLDIQDGFQCDDIYRGERLPYGFNSSSMICAGYSPGGKDTCQGDSGGPLQFLNPMAGCAQIYSQVGIVSFGEGCASPYTPAVYTKVSFFIPWIESIVWK